MLKSTYADVKFPQGTTKAIEQPAKDELPPRQSILKRMWKHPRLMHYHRLIALVTAVNLAFFAIPALRNMWWTAGGVNLTAVNLTAVSNLIIANFFLGIIVRQQYVINLLFKIATSVPKRWPLAIRWIAGKVYHFGGLHVGGTVVGTLWFAFFVGVLAYRLINGLPSADVGIVAVTGTLLALLIFIIVMAMPPLRAKYHDQFEITHRFGGWASLILFWVQTILFANMGRGEASLGIALLTSPAFWMLAIITVSIALPWLRLKKVKVNIDTPSSHVALAHFDYGVTPFAGSSTALSRNPLIEWHSFANVPAPGVDGYRLTISRAGDWTGDFIDDRPEHVWVKGIPTAGVGNIDKLFNRVIWVATGSGIGPCLPHLLENSTPSRLVWSTRTPRQTYGDQLVDEILEVQPDAIIWDTNEQGRPDLVKLAYKAYKAFDAEAIICISNKKLTWQVVYGMESRGIPAYGAIWDS